MPGARFAEDLRNPDVARWTLVTARDLMRKPLVTVDRHAPLSEAARLLTGNGISGAPVVDSHGRIVGVVSFRDLVERFVEQPAARPPRASEEPVEEEDDQDLEQEYSGKDAPAEEDLVEDVMTSEIRSVRVDASLPEIAEAMKRHNVHRLLVEDHDGRYVGLIGTFEVLDVLFP